MRVGRMNNPAAKLRKEIRTTAELGFDYLELTVEPPAARSDRLDAGEVRRMLDDAGLGVVGHTAFYLPIADPFPRVRAAALEQLKCDLDFFAELGCEHCTIHPHRGISVGHSELDRLKLQAISFKALVAHGEQVGVQVLLENLAEFVGDPELLATHLFDGLPGLGLTLDVAHAALRVPENRTAAFLARLGDRLRHVHVSDNDGQNDLHQPLGSCRLPLQRLVKTIRDTGYDGGITLEVFVREPAYLQRSLELVRAWWNET